MNPTAKDEEESVACADAEESSAGVSGDVAEEVDLEVDACLVSNNISLTEETACFFRIFQKFANKKVYVCLYGLISCFIGANFAYFNGTITTLEKRFQIPSQTIGLISSGNAFSQIFLTAVLSYFAGKRHRPRWLGFGCLTIVSFCWLTALPDVLFSNGNQRNESWSDGLCHLEQPEPCLETPDGTFYPQLILFAAQCLGGIGVGLFYSIGASYLDDNIQKAKIPALLNVSYFLEMLGPPLGYFLASIFLSVDLRPSSSLGDPNHLGAWWLGWIILGSVNAVLGLSVGLFPKSLPRAVARQALLLQKHPHLNSQPEEQVSILDLFRTFQRLVTNKIYVFNNLGSIFYNLGFLPYSIFLPKYLEVLFKKSASSSSLNIGNVGLIFSILGVVVSGWATTKLKPSARSLAGWHVLVGFLSLLAMVSFVFLSCEDVNGTHLLATNNTCNQDCHCDFVPFSSVCANGKVDEISPCHAGCKASEIQNGSLVFTNCSTNAVSTEDSSDYWKFLPGACTSAADCDTPFYVFLTIIGALRFLEASKKSSTFLLGVRCVEKQDKTVSMGFSLSVHCCLAFFPVPFIFGYILDSACSVWGKTCSSSGNCWKYHDQQLRLIFNLTAASFTIIGVLFNIGVWCFSKNLEIFDNGEENTRERFLAGETATETDGP